MGTDSSLPSLAALGAPSSPRIPTKLTIDGSSDVNNIKIAKPTDCSIPPSIDVDTLKPQTPSLQGDVARLKEGKSTFKTNAYFRAGVIKPGTYSGSLIRGAKRQNLTCAGCNAVRGLGIEHCHKHDSDKYGKGPQKRLRR